MNVLIVVVSLLLAIVGCSAQHDDTASQTAAIVNGQLDPGDPHVVALVSRAAVCGDAPITKCTGTLIAPRVVVTAAHCVASGGSGLEVTLGGDTSAPSDIVYVVDALLHPQWNATTFENDIALLLLAQPLTDAPATLLTTMDASFVGQSARVVGYGVAEGGIEPGTKRTGTTSIMSVDALDFRIVPSPSMSCRSDSGGPVFVTVGNVEFLAGITAWGDAECAQFGVNTRVDIHIATFIQPYLDNAAMVGSPDAGPPRPAPVDVCNETCARDEDCPEATVCQPENGVMRCGTEGLPSGTFAAAPCAVSNECTDGLCVAQDRQGRPACICYTLCNPPIDPDGCACTIATPRRSRSPLAVIAVALLFAFAWHRRRPPVQDRRS